MRNKFLRWCLVSYCIFASGCTVVRAPLKRLTSPHKTTVDRDGPPREERDVSRIKNAVPRIEPYHPYGTRDYVVRGKKYRVLKHTKNYVRYGNVSWYGSKFHGRHTSTQERYDLYGMTAASKELPLPSYVEVTNLKNGKKVIVRVNDRGPFHANRILDLSYAAAKKLGFEKHGVTRAKVVAIDPHAWHARQRKLKKAMKPVAKPAVKPMVKSATKPLAVPEVKSITKSSVVPAVKTLSEKPTESPVKQELTVAQPVQNQKDVISAKQPHDYLQVAIFARRENAQCALQKIAKVTKLPVKITSRGANFMVQVGPVSSASEGDALKTALKKIGYAKPILFKQ